MFALLLPYYFIPRVGQIVGQIIVGQTLGQISRAIIVGQLNSRVIGTGRADDVYLNNIEVTRVRMVNHEQKNIGREDACGGRGAYPLSVHR